MNYKKSNNILIITQKVDLNDTVLGFFHQWLMEMSGQFDQISVICLEKGEYNLPDNISVYSLGKESGVSQLKYLINFYKLIISLHKKYNYVFVHMNSEYVILGGLLWKVLSKKIFLWYNHKVGGIKASLAGMLSDRIFYTSSYSYFAKNKKSEIMPVGIDTNVFKKTNKVIQGNKILSIGRISPVKNIDVLIQAVQYLDEEGFDFSVDIYGDVLDRDIDYFNNLKNKAKNLIDKKKVRFLPGVTYDKIPSVYNQYSLFINLTNSGSFDKTILEAMACEIPLIVCNKSLEGVVPKQFLFEDGDVYDLQYKIEEVLSLDNDSVLVYNKKLRQYVLDSHNLDTLAKKIKQNVLSIT